MLARVLSAAIVGLDAVPVDVEVDVSPGIPTFAVVGLPDGAVREARERVRSAIRNTGFEMPARRITVNLAPVDSRKEGPAFDLPIALGILGATRQIPPSGIDGAAHSGVLRVGGVTVGVLGCGVDVAYPPEHGRLMEAIRQHGALVSDLPMGTQRRRQQFPRRNRLISGLARAVVVVEGDVDSGALVTARCALAQGRRVFAVPGSIHAPGSRGSHYLLAQGATVLGAPTDVLERLGLVHAATSAPPVQLEGGAPDNDAAPVASIAGRTSRGEACAAPAMVEPGTEAMVLAVMEEEALHIDVVISRARRQAAEVTAALAMLEVRGLVRQFPGKHFARVQARRW